MLKDSDNNKGQVKDNGTESAAYSDSTDKATGVAAMALLFLSLRTDTELLAIDIDRPAGDNMIFRQTPLSAVSPYTVAKQTWEHAVRDFRMMLTLALGNIAFRRGSDRAWWQQSNLMRRIKEFAMTQAQECALEADEVDVIFDNCRNHVERLYRHPQVREAVRVLADTLEKNRRMDINEISELLGRQGLGI